MEKDIQAIDWFRISDKLLLMLIDTEFERERKFPFLNFRIGEPTISSCMSLVSLLFSEKSFWNKNVELSDPSDSQLS